MSIDTATEHLLTLAEAAKAFPGRSVSLQTLHRYRLHGVRGVKLETLLIGGARFTSREAIQRFIVAQNAADTSDAAAVSTKQRQRQISSARQELAAMGVGSAD